jgi:hypothetical protein
MNLGTLQDLFGRSGPFVSIHMDVSRNVPDPREHLGARWTNVRRDLEGEGLDEGLIDDIGARLQQAPELEGDMRRTIVAADGAVAFDDVRAGRAPWQEYTTSSPLPDLAGWLSQAAADVPFVLVRADHEGADIEVYQAASRGREEHEEVSGDTLHLHKVQVGGWGHKQFQRRSDNVWRKNADEVASTVLSACRRHRPSHVFLAGDDRSRHTIADGLESTTARVVQVRSGGRGAGSSQEALWEEVGRALARAEAETERDVAELLRERSGQGQGVAHGVKEVLEALVQGSVDRLVVDLAQARQATVAPSQHTGIPLPAAALSADSLPADQVLVAAGVATDAQLTLLPVARINDSGVAALLRWDT